MHFFSISAIIHEILTTNKNIRELKVKKNAFSLPLNFSLDFLLMQKNGLIRKIVIYGVTTWLTIPIHILPNISRSKGNQTKCIQFH